MSDGTLRVQTVSEDTPAELVQEFLAECRENLATMESDLLEIERYGTVVDEQIVNRVFRAAHSIKGGAGPLNLSTIRQLAHHVESALDLIRSRRIIPGREVVNVLLRSFDRLGELLLHFEESNDADISAVTAALAALTSGEGARVGVPKISLERRK